MPDLSSKASHQFWYDFEDKMIYRVISFMEGVEDWVLDGDPKVEAAMQEFSQELENISGIDLDKLDKQDLFVDICNAIRTGRTLRLMQGIDTTHPGSASKLLIYAEEHSKTADDPPGLFLRRNIVFERLRLLGRVFSAERFALILKALEGEEYEEIE